MLDAAIRLRPELLDFLRQDHTATCKLEETTSALEGLAARLETGTAMVPAK